MLSRPDRHQRVLLQGTVRPHGASLCSAVTHRLISRLLDIDVTFLSPSGDVPMLDINQNELTGTVVTIVSQIMLGTKEDTVCNNRGRCGT